MLKKIIILIITINTLLFFSVKKTNSFGLDNPNTIMGVNCGVPNSDINKCCKSLNLNIDFKTGNPIVDIPLAPVRAPLEILFGIASRAINEGIKAYTNMKEESACIPGSKMSVPNRNDANCICIQADSPGALSALLDLCKNISKKEEKQECINCITSNNPVKKPGVWTAIGCIYPYTSSFIQQNLIGLGVSLGGIISLLCIIYSAVIIQTSQGNPEKIKKARELLTSCISGLILIIFSIFILRIIGITILKIPGFY
ncbi:MAG: hypothetical protein QHH09_04620 [Microgenomates group bacterium]|nr:hypothetical protein [Microgenomates group bacterium]